MVGLMLITLLKHADRVKVACLAQLVNVIAPIMTENGGGICEQTIVFPFMLSSINGRGTVLLSNTVCGKHDTREFTDVPDVDSVAVLSDDGNALTVFAVNRDPNESYDMCIKLLDLEDFSGKGHIEMCGFDKNAVNGFDKINVFPVNGENPTVDGKTAHAVLKPFSWNVIRFYKNK